MKRENVSLRVRIPACLGSAIEKADGNVEILLSVEKEGIVHDSTKSLSKK